MEVTDVTDAIELTKQIIREQGWSRLIELYTSTMDDVPLRSKISGKVTTISETQVEEWVRTKADIKEEITSALIQKFPELILQPRPEIRRSFEI